MEAENRDPIKNRKQDDDIAVCVCNNIMWFDLSVSHRPPRSPDALVCACLCVYACLPVRACERMWVTYSERDHTEL